MKFTLKKIDCFLENKWPRVRTIFYSSFLFAITFLISSYRASEIQGHEDFIDSRQLLFFLEDPVIENLMYEAHNAMEFFALPFYRIIGFNLTALRMSQSVLLSFSVVFFFLFSRNYFGDSVKAFLSSLLLVSFPFFITLKYWPEYAAVAFFSTLLLYIFSELKNRDSSFIFALYGFVLGVGIFTKVIIAPFGVGLLLFYLVTDFKNAQRKLLKVNNLASLLIFGLFGLSPFLAFNIKAQTLQSFVMDSFGATRGSFLNNISIRIGDIRDIFITSPQYYSGEVEVVGRIGFVFFLLSSIYFLFRKKKGELIILGTIIFYIFVSVTEVQALLTEHLYILIPSFVIIMVSAGFILSDFIERKTNINILYLPVLILIFLNLFNTVIILKSDNSYNDFYTINKIGYTIQDHGGIDNIYHTMARDGFLTGSRIISFTSGGSKVFYIKPVLEDGFSEIKIVDPGQDNDPNTGDFPLNWIYVDVDDVLEFEKNSLYIDAYQKRYIPEGGSGQEDNSQILKRYLGDSYKKIKIEEKLKRGYFLIWVHQKNKDLIQKLKSI